MSDKLIQCDLTGAGKSLQSGNILNNIMYKQIGSWFSLPHRYNFKKVETTRQEPDTELYLLHIGNPTTSTSTRLHAEKSVTASAAR